MTCRRAEKDEPHDLPPFVSGRRHQLRKVASAARAWAARCVPACVPSLRTDPGPELIAAQIEAQLLHLHPNPAMQSHIFSRPTQFAPARPQRPFEAHSCPDMQTFQAAHGSDFCALLEGTPTAIPDSGPSTARAARSSA